MKVGLIGHSTFTCVTLAAVLYCIALCVTVPAYVELRDSPNRTDSFHTMALSCNVASIVSFLAVLVVSIVFACLARHSSTDGEKIYNFYTPMSYATVILAESIAITGTTVAGLLLMFSGIVKTSLVWAAAGLNLVAAGGGVVAVVVASLVLLITKRRGHCSLLGRVTFIVQDILVVMSLVAALLTIFFHTNVTVHSSVTEYRKGLSAAFFSGLTGGAFFLSMFVCYSLIIWYEKMWVKYKEVAAYGPRVAMVMVLLWLLLTFGNILSGGLMMAVSTRIPSDATHHESLGYLVGAFNFINPVVCFTVLIVATAIFVYYTSRQGTTSISTEN